MHAEPIGVQRFFRYVGDELVRRPRVVFVVIVAQGEVAEFHHTPPMVHRALRLVLVVAGSIDAFATVVNATDRTGLESLCTERMPPSAREL
jgi:hypothetical protein